MKCVILLASLFIIINSCQNNKISNSIIFDEEEFVLIKTTYDSSGSKILDFYRHKKDTSRFFTKNYWGNGAIQASIYYHKLNKMGPMRMFDTNEVLEFEGTYIKNLHTGLDVYYRNGKVSDFSFFLNGKEMPIDSIQKEHILE